MIGQKFVRLVVTVLTKVATEKVRLFHRRFAYIG